MSGPRIKSVIFSFQPGQCCPHRKQLQRETEKEQDELQQVARPPVQGAQLPQGPGTALPH